MLDGVPGVPIRGLTQKRGGEPTIVASTTAPHLGARAPGVSPSRR
jgi:hypothetical protein